MEKIRLLLIEDDDDLRETASEFLLSEGFNVVSAPNGATGVQKAIQSPPDVIVCDINMPDISGYEVYGTLSQIASIATIPFIFLSAKSTREDILLGLHLGVDDYITKPFEMSELVGVINRRVEGRRKLLAQSDEKFNTLIDSSPSGACILNEESIEYANRALCELLGYTPKELTGLPIKQLIHCDSRDSFCSTLHQCIYGVKQPITTTILIERKNGQQIEVQSTCNPTSIRSKRRVICTMVQVDRLVPKEGGGKRKAVKLSEREVDVLKLICKGLSNHEIGEQLFVSVRTVEGHKSRIFSKTSTKNTVALVLWAVRNGYVDL